MYSQELDDLLFDELALFDLLQGATPLALFCSGSENPCTSRYTGLTFSSSCKVAYISFIL